MRWRMGRRSDNVEDRRGVSSPRRGVAVGGGLGVLLLAIAAMFLGIDPSIVLEQAAPRNQSSYPDSTITRRSPESDFSAFAARKSSLF